MHSYAVRVSTVYVDIAGDVQTDAFSTEVFALDKVGAAVSDLIGSAIACDHTVTGVTVTPQGRRRRKH